MTQSFDATEVLNDIRKLRAIRRRYPYRRSRLARFRSELVALRKQGASYQELTLWLRTKRIKVSHTTVLRYLAQLPELQSSSYASLS